MTRRDAVKTASLLVSATVAAAAGLSGCAKPEAVKTAKSGDTVALENCCSLPGPDEALLVAFADTLLPDTVASPGARAAGCGRIMNMLYSQCADAATQQRIMTGMRRLRERAATFESMTPRDREQLLITIDREAVRAGATHWFHSLRELSHEAYFASEIGMTKALRYVRVPGRWVGCVPLTPGQPAWG
jgi:hypothetical protein